MIPNGAVNETGFTTGDVAVYYCVVGYLIKGDPTRTCGSDLEWTGSTPSCIRESVSSIIRILEIWTLLQCPLLPYLTMTVRSLAQLVERLPRWQNVLGLNLT